MTTPATMQKQNSRSTDSSTALVWLSRTGQPQRRAVTPTPCAASAPRTTTGSAASASEAERFRLAFEWYQRAADTAHMEGSPSLSALGWETEQQQQQQQQQQQHGEWAGAHREAWSNLASMYALGHGIPKCVSTAKHILRFLESSSGAASSNAISK